MLNVYMNDCEEPLDKEYISAVSVYFNNRYKPEWFTDNFVKRLIWEVDETEVVGTGKGVNLYQEVLGNFSPDRLSNGCKSLILLYKKDGIKLNGDRLGDNCIELMLEISVKKDITVAFGHIPHTLPKQFEAVCLNDGRKLSGKRDFVNAFVHHCYTKKQVEDCSPW